MIIRFMILFTFAVSKLTSFLVRTKKNQRKNFMNSTQKLFQLKFCNCLGLLCLKGSSLAGYGCRTAASRMHTGGFLDPPFSAPFVYILPEKKLMYAKDLLWRERD